MGNALLEYLNNRLGEQKAGITLQKSQGPLITISREVGCNGVKLADQLADSLNRGNMNHRWRVLSKEVFYQSAKELGIDPGHVQKVFKFDSYAFNEILSAFGTKKFKSDKKVIKTVTEVIHAFAVEGYCIIVGRAAQIIAHDIKKSLHVRLVAPLEYRINTIMTNKHLNRVEAIDFIERVEKERAAFRKAIKNESLDAASFDICLNRASFQDKEAVELIEFAAKKKSIFNDFVAYPYFH